LKQFEKFGLLTYYELFEGVRLYEKPWYYIPKMVLITAPVGLLFGVFIGPIINWFKKDTLGKLILFLLVFATVFPLAYAIYKKSYVYNGWRHFLFIYPTLTVLSILAWHQLGLFIKNKAIGLVIWGLFIVTLISPIIWNIKNHPYQYMYFNEIIGGIKGAHGNYDIDYWNQTPREAFEWLVKNKPEILEKDNNGNPKFKINVVNQAETQFDENLGADPVPYALWVKNADPGADPHQFFDPHQHPDGDWGTKHGFRDAYEDPDRIAQLIDSGKATINPQERQAIYSELQRILFEDPMWVYAAQEGLAYPYRSSLNGFTVNPLWRGPHYEYYSKG
jgi:ABC-type transport system substrate-binding protein